MDTRWIVLIIAYVIVQASAMGFLYLSLCEVLRRLERIEARRAGLRRRPWGRIVLREPRGDFNAFD